MTLLDANVLVGLVAPNDWRFEFAHRAINVYEQQNAPMILIPQVIYEFWVIATKPKAAKNGGLGMTTKQARDRIDKFLSFTHFLEDGPKIYDIWEELVLKHDVKGKPAHDARIIAAMINSPCNAILTFNGKDFIRYVNDESIEVIDPRTVN